MFECLCTMQSVSITCWLHCYSQKQSKTKQNYAMILEDLVRVSQEGSVEHLAHRGDYVLTSADSASSLSTEPPVCISQARRPTGNVLASCQWSRHPCWSGKNLIPIVVLFGKSVSQDYPLGLALFRTWAPGTRGGPLAQL